MRTLLIVLSIAFSLFAELIVVKEGDSIAKTMIKARPGDTLVVSDGTYKESIMLKRGVTIIAKNRHKAIIKGDGRGEVVTMSSDATIDGLVIRDGGNGVLNSVTRSKIVNCIITNNRQSGILLIKTIPIINNCAISFNGSSGIQGSEIAQIQAPLEHLTLVRNGHSGINISSSVQVDVLNSIFFRNGNFAINFDKKLTVNNNIIFPAGRHYVEKNRNVQPEFISLRNSSFNFSLTDVSPGKRQSLSGSDIGVNW